MSNKLMTILKFCTPLNTNLWPGPCPRCKIGPKKLAALEYSPCDSSSSSGQLRTTRGASVTRQEGREGYIAGERSGALWLPD